MFCMKLKISFTEYRLQMSNKKNSQQWHYTAATEAAKVIYLWTAVSYANSYDNRINTTTIKFKFFYW